MQSNLVFDSIFDSRISLADLYNQAIKTVISFGYNDEIEWQRSRSIESFTEEDLLRESAWVILCSGFKEQYVRRVFDKVSLCFCDWESSSEIVLNLPQCRDSAFHVFANRKKIDAIASVAIKINSIGFAEIQKRILMHPMDELKNLPFIGPITSYHLAKNLGLDVAKPDRHLVRIANKLGYLDVQQLCMEIAQVTGEVLTVIDLVLWRFVTLIISQPEKVSMQFEVVH